MSVSLLNWLGLPLGESQFVVCGFRGMCGNIYITQVHEGQCRVKFPSQCSCNGPNEKHLFKNKEPLRQRVRKYGLNGHFNLCTVNHFWYLKVSLCNLMTNIQLYKRVHINCDRNPLHSNSWSPSINSIVQDLICYNAVILHEIVNKGEQTKLVTVQVPGQVPWDSCHQSQFFLGSMWGCIFF